MSISVVRLDHLPLTSGAGSRSERAQGRFRQPYRPAQPRAYRGFAGRGDRQFGAAQAKLRHIPDRLDRFKQVNDTLGHPAGDVLLQRVAERLGAVLGGDGQAGRLGGDEFQAVFPASARRAGWRRSPTG
jgi:hypothetical protein